MGSAIRCDDEGFLDFLRMVLMINPAHRPFADEVTQTPIPATAEPFAHSTAQHSEHVVNKQRQVLRGFLRLSRLFACTQAGDHPWLAAGYEADGMTPVPTAASDPDAPDAEGTAGGEVAAPAEGAD